MLRELFHWSPQPVLLGCSGLRLHVSPSYPRYSILEVLWLGGLLFFATTLSATMSCDSHPLRNIITQNETESPSLHSLTSGSIPAIPSESMQTHPIAGPEIWRILETPVCEIECTDRNLPLGPSDSRDHTPDSLIKSRSLPTMSQYYVAR